VPDTLFLFSSGGNYCIKLLILEKMDAIKNGGLCE
jgi:hypothetical protein